MTGSPPQRGRLQRLKELSGERRVRVAGGVIHGEIVDLRTRTLRFAAWFALTVAVIWLAAWWLFAGDPCVESGFHAEFAGTSGRFAELSTSESGCDLGTMRSFLARTYLFAAVYAGGLGLALTVWWNASWDTEPGYSRVPGVALGGVAAATFVAEVVERTVILVGVHAVDGTSSALALSYAPAVATLAWIKWALVSVVVASTLAMVAAWLIRSAAVLWQLLRRVSEVDQLPPVERWEPDPDRPALGIGLSGGGIRSAAFSLGALSALEETEVRHPRPGRSPGVLGQADLLASVSGGGYAASAWRTAVGFGDEAIIDRPIIGDPNRYSAGDGAEPIHGPGVGPEESDLFPRLRDLRGYLRNGRGGLLVSAVVVVVQMVWHFLVIAALIAIVAWPLGRLIGSWIISSPASPPATGRVIDDGAGLAVPVIGLSMILLAVLVARSFTLVGRPRRWLDRVAAAVAALAVLLATMLLLLPWLILEVGSAIDTSAPADEAEGSGLMALIAVGVVASVLRLVQAPLASRAQYLGGILLVVGLSWLGVSVAYDATVQQGPFALGWIPWLALVMVYAVVVTVTNPDLWSLHWVYRRRLAQSFANRWDPVTGRWDTLALADLPPLSAYRGAPGPQQVICAVAARAERTNTGIRAVSMTFEPDRVTLHCGPDPDAPGASLSHAIATDRYEDLFHGRLAADRYRSVFCATSLSAAAFAPSLGRYNLGSTNALIAALNLRLGTWMPNPMFRRGRRAAPDLFSMFKELGGRYDLAEPNVYVTDGGHWENLALVELVRRRARAIIAVDASGDRELTFAALAEAIELAQLECATRISLLDEGLDGMRPGSRPMALRNWCRAEIHYPDGSIGRLLYVKAQASEQMPLDVLRYSKEDPTFPNYSTADQFLGESEFGNLAILGRESMIAALDEHHRWLFDDSGDETALATAAPGAEDGGEAIRANRPITSAEIVRTPSRRADKRLPF